jgi:hypothetical protein
MSKIAARQYELVAEAEFDYSELPTGIETEVVDLPPGAIVTGGFAHVETADNAATSAVLNVGDSADPDRYVTVLDLKTAAGVSEAFAVTVLGRKYPSGGAITATRTAVGAAATAGKTRIVVFYVIEGRANEVQT